MKWTIDECQDALGFDTLRLSDGSVNGDIYASPIATIYEPSAARLIAAAPELLEALKLAEDVLSRFPFSTEIWPNGIHPNKGIETIRAAIAKAEGPP